MPLRRWSNTPSCPGKLGVAADQSTFSARAALIASHSVWATTPRKASLCTTRAPRIEAIDAASTFTGTAPDTAGRIIRPCSMPGTFTLVR